MFLLSDSVPQNCGKYSINNNNKMEVIKPMDFSSYSAFCEHLNKSTAAATAAAAAAAATATAPSLNNGIYLEVKIQLQQRQQQQSNYQQ